MLRSRGECPWRAGAEITESSSNHCQSLSVVGRYLSRNGCLLRISLLIQILSDCAVLKLQKTVIEPV